jgi:hypothetical protein
MSFGVMPTSNVTPGPGEKSPLPEEKSCASYLVISSRMLADLRRKYITSLCIDLYKLYASERLGCRSVAWLLGILADKSLRARMIC